MTSLSIQQRTEQLCSALKILESAIGRFQEEKNKEEITVLSSQIRALVCKGGRNFHPLLLEIADIKEVKLCCFAPQDLRKYPSFVKEAQFFYRPEIIDTVPRERWVEYDLKDWLDSEIIILNQVVYTPNDILRLKADSEASHYDSETSQKLENLKQIERQTEGSSLSEPDFYVLQTARIVLVLGTDLIK